VRPGFAALVAAIAAVQSPDTSLHEIRNYGPPDLPDFTDFGHGCTSSVWWWSPGQVAPRPNQRKQRKLARRVR
jgi:hypothetical protein